MNAPYRPSEQAEGLTSYRPFIDGLRAVSILAVVLYHIGIPGIRGGYVGVDVFFVISGFLIISQIVEGLERGTFSFAAFWARRALRILPPYLLVLAFTIAAAPFVLLMPDEFEQLAAQIGFAAAMVVNHLFLSQQGYFDTASDAKVLLHLWSLAVEEQFYLVAPLLLGLLWWLPGRLGRSDVRPRLVLWTAAGVFALSLLACVFSATIGRNHAFYLAAPRAWEFIAGGAVGFLLPAAKRLPEGAKAALSALGLAAIVGCALLYRVDTPYPSWRALVPVSGATAVILGGLVRPSSPAIRLLAAPPMVWIGLVSYAWYLWHWPLLSLARIWRFGERSLPVDLAVGLLSLGLAAATHYLVERPIRRWRQAHIKPLGWRPVFAGVAACAAVAILAPLPFKAASRDAASVIASRFMPDGAGGASYCNLRDSPAEDCLRLAAGRPVGLLIGDSHAISARARLAALAGSNGGFLVTVASAGCMTFSGAREIVADEQMTADCTRLRETALGALRGGEIKADYAVLYGRWPIYGAPDGWIKLGPVEGDQAAPDQDEAFIDGLRRTIADLRSFGLRRILVIGPTPVFGHAVPSCVFRAERRDIDPAAKCGLARAAAVADRAVAVVRLGTALAGEPELRYVDPFADLCDASRCFPSAGGKILFTDTNHLSDAGMDRIVAGHRADFDWLVGDGAP